MSADTANVAPSGSIAAWCEQHLGSPPVHSFITEGPTSQPWGFELADGRVIAVKVRPTSARLEACIAAHRTAHAAGIDCPAWLAGPAPMAGDSQHSVVAETWRGDGAGWPSEDPPGSYGRLQAALIAALSGIDPAVFTPSASWLRYDHRVSGRLWAPDTAAPRDLEDVKYELPLRMTGYAAAARQRLLAANLPDVVGHAGLNAVHVRWLRGPGGVPAPVVHGWEELAARPEAVLVGILATRFNELPDQPRIAPIVEGEQVLDAYQAASGRAFSDEEMEVAWAASTWVACYGAAMEHVQGAPGQVTHQVMTDGPLRLKLAGC